MNKVTPPRSDPARRHTCFVMFWGIFLFACLLLQTRRLKKIKQQAELLKTFRLNEVVSAVGRFSLKSQIIPSLGIDVRAADSSTATANRQTEEGAKNVSAGTRLNVAFCLPQRHVGNRTRVNKVI